MSHEAIAALAVAQYWPGTLDSVVPGTPPPDDGQAENTSPSSVAAPTTSVNDMSPVTLDAVVLEALLPAVGSSEAAYDAAVRNPGDASLVAGIELATVADSPARLEFVGAYEAIAAAGQWAVADEVVPNSVTVLSGEGLTMSADGSAAFVWVCEVSGDALMGRDAAGNPVVLSDQRNARVIVQEFRLVDGGWRLFQRWLVDVVAEGVSCGEGVGASSVPVS